MCGLYLTFVNQSKIGTKKILTEVRIYNQLTIKFKSPNEENVRVLFNDLDAIIHANLIKQN